MIYDTEGRGYQLLNAKELAEYFPTKPYRSDTMPDAESVLSGIKVKHLHHMVDAYLAECSQSVPYEHYKTIASKLIQGQFKSTILKRIVKNMMVVMMNPQQHSQNGDIWRAVCMAGLSIAQVQVITKLSGLQSYEKYNFDLHGWIESNKNKRGIPIKRLIHWAKRFETVLYPLAEKRMPYMIAYGKRHNCDWLHYKYKEDPNTPIRAHVRPPRDEAEAEKRKANNKRRMEYYFRTGK